MYHEAQDSRPVVRGRLKTLGVDLLLFVPRLALLPVMLTIAAVKVGLWDPLLGGPSH